MSGSERVYLGIPCYGGLINYRHFDAILHGSKRNLIHRMEFGNCSLLTQNFNRMFANALNLRRDLGITHFALLHDDVIPRQQGWLDLLFDEMKEHRLDVISAIVPIKDDKGLTSTAFDVSCEGSDVRYRPTRLSLKEAFEDYPETIVQDDLLINTGCFLMDITKSFAEKIWFEFENVIENQNGQFVARCVPEDWNFSRRAKAKGAKLGATRKVHVWHAGKRMFTNEFSWGAYEKDRITHLVAK